MAYRQGVVVICALILLKMAAIKARGKPGHAVPVVTRRASNLRHAPRLAAGGVECSARRRQAGPAGTPPALLGKHLVAQWC